MFQIVYLFQHVGRDYLPVEYGKDGTQIFQAFVELASAGRRCTQQMFHHVLGRVKQRFSQWSVAIFGLNIGSFRFINHRCNREWLIINKYWQCVCVSVTICESSNWFVSQLCNKLTRWNQRQAPVATLRPRPLLVLSARDGPRTLCACSWLCTCSCWVVIRLGVRCDSWAPNGRLGLNSHDLSWVSARPCWRFWLADSSWIILNVWRWSNPML